MAMTLEDRLTRLERKNRRLTLAMLLTGVAAALVVTIGAARPEAVRDVVRAHSFVLLDENGKMRALLAVTENEPMLGLADENGRVRAGMAIDKGSPRFVLWDENSTEQASLSLSKKGPGLQLGSKEMMRMSKDAVVFQDKESKPRVLLGLGEDGPMFDFCNKEGKPTITMGMRKGLSQTNPELFRAMTREMRKGLRQGPFPEIVVYSPDYSTYSQLDSDGLALVHSNGPHATFQIGEDGPTLWFMDKPQWSPRLMLDLSKKLGPTLTLTDENDKIRQYLDVKGLFKGE